MTPVRTRPEWAGGVLSHARQVRPARPAPDTHVHTNRQSFRQTFRNTDEPSATVKNRQKSGELAGVYL